MFRFPNLRGKLEATKNLLHIEVTKEEFIQLLLDSGMTEDKARQTTVISKALGSSIQIKNMMVKIKE